MKPFISSVRSCGVLKKGVLKRFFSSNSKACACLVTRGAVRCGVMTGAEETVVVAKVVVAKPLEVPCSRGPRNA